MDTAGALIPERFEVRERLGEGSFGAVFRVWDRALNAEVALKTLHRPDAAELRYLKTEFRARVRLQHRNLVQFYELEVAADHCFLTMELVEGKDLASWVRWGAAAPSPSDAASSPAVAGSSAEAPTLGATAAAEARTLDGSELERADALPAAAPLLPEAMPRLRAAVRELLHGLIALHNAGIVHRDIKPGNIRVAPNGRVVLLDFGLAVSPLAVATAPRRAGTPHYMAPEQCRGEQATPAADMYAVGCVIYELLSGCWPFRGNSWEIIQAKAAGRRPAPLPFDGGDPGLAAAVRELLTAEAGRRPTARSLLRRLQGAAGPPEAETVFGAPTQANFFGRAAPMRVLQDALDRVRRERKPVVVTVVGPSGIGKSTLLRQFLEREQARDSRLLVLHSRCHPHETIAFKALDAAMDELAGYLADPSADAADPFPGDAYAAVRLFPALQRAAGLRAQPPAILPSDTELREQGFQSLRALFQNLGNSTPLALWIDDLQWGDLDSLQLIEALLQPPVKLPLLVLFSFRSDAGGETALLDRVRNPDGLFAPVPVELAALEPEAIAGLAAHFLHAANAQVEFVVRHAEGNPFMACELARYISRRPPGEAEAAPPDLPRLLAHRLEELDADWRKLAEAVAVAVRPVSAAVALEAAGLGPPARSALLALCDSYFLREVPSSRGLLVAPYHDRIAQALQQNVADGDRPRLHGALATALERHEPEDSDALLAHWEAAGNRQRAGVHAVRAAERAASQLAFERAVALYYKALQLAPASLDRDALLERAATAHANCGNAPHAAELFLQASACAGGDVAQARIRLLKQRAAEQYVKSGHVGQGWQVMRSVLEAVGVAQPASPRAAIAAAMLRRLRFWLRPVSLKSALARHIPAAERPRLDALWTASTSVAMINHLVSDAFRTMHLNRIVAVGDASTLCRALAYEYAFEVTVGGALFDRHATRVMAWTRQLAGHTGDPYDRAWMHLAAAVGEYSAGRWRAAVEECVQAEHGFRTECVGASWELSAVATYQLTALAMLGEIPALKLRLRQFAGEAERAGDLFSIAEAGSGEPLLAWLSEGQAEAAFARARAAIARQSVDAVRWPEKACRRSALTELLAAAHLSLAQDDPWRGWDVIQRNWTALRTDLFAFQLQFYKSALRHARGRVALAAAAAGGRSDWPRPRLLADAAEQVRHLRKDAKPFAAPWAALLEAGLAHARGERDSTLRSLQTALAGFTVADMGLYREAARWTLGHHSRQPALQQEAAAWMQSKEIPDPARFAAILSPGLGLPRPRAN